MRSKTLHQYIKYEPILSQRVTCVAPRLSCRHRISLKFHLSKHKLFCFRQQQNTLQLHKYQNVQNALLFVPFVFASTVFSGFLNVGIGFIIAVTTKGSPFVIPPSIPPALLVLRTILPSLRYI